MNNNNIYFLILGISGIPENFEKKKPDFRDYYLGRGLESLDTVILDFRKRPAAVTVDLSKNSEIKQYNAYNK